MQPGAALQAMLLAALLAGPRGATGRLLSASDLDLSGGQLVCRGGTQKPCYKVIYFHDASRRLNFEEAKAACRRDGGQLVSIESEDEQRLIEKFIENLLASDGDFWIGLRRREEKQSNGTACQDLYAWTDGSTSTFRNWYVDEPSCGSEVCVVMYHQPSAPAGIGGRYMFQWNDDQCNMKNNFICKYSDERPTAPSTKPGGEGTEPATPMLPEDTRKEDARETFKGNKVFMFCVTEVTPCVSRIREPHCGRQMKSDIVRLQFSSGISHTKLGQSPHVKGTVYSKSLQTSVTSSGVPRPPPLLATNPEDAHNPLRFDSSLEQLTEFRKIPYVGLHFIVKDTDHHQPAEETEAALNLAYILIPSIVLLLVVITVVCWVWIYRKRKGEQPGPSTKEQHTIWPSPHAGNSPDLEVYNIIRKQSEADLAETRPDLKNISFRVCSGEATLDDLSCDYDNMAVNPSESGFVTLASVESGFVTNDIYEFSSDRMGRSKESGWVENEIYGY